MATSPASGPGGGSGLPAQWTVSSGALDMAPTDATLGTLLEIDPPANWYSLGSDDRLIFIATPTGGTNVKLEPNRLRLTAPAGFEMSSLALTGTDHAHLAEVRSGGEAGTANGVGPFEARNSAGTTIFAVHPLGAVCTAQSVAPADGDLSTGQLALWFDSTIGASKLMVKAKSADGTVVTAAIALA